MLNIRYYLVFNNIFNDFFTTDSHGTPSDMKIDIVKKDGNYELSIVMPVVKKEDIKMELKDGYLKVTTSLDTNKENKDKEGRIIRQERVSGSYSRSFYVGNKVSTEDVKTSFNNGELVVTVSKKAPKKVEENKFIPILNSRYTHRIFFIARKIKCIDK